MPRVWVTMLLCGLAACLQDIRGEDAGVSPGSSSASTGGESSGTTSGASGTSSASGTSGAPGTSTGGGTTDGSTSAGTGGSQGTATLQGNWAFTPQSVQYYPGHWLDGGVTLSELTAEIITAPQDCSALAPSEPYRLLRLIVRKLSPRSDIPVGSYPIYWPYGAPTTGIYATVTLLEGDGQGTSGPVARGGNGGQLTLTHVDAWELAGSFHTTLVYLDGGAIPDSGLDVTFDAHACGP